ncbi:MAG: type IV pilus twitching motility protein PilT [Candidatus Omnitrophica bacterium]|nr:type IV pilus twitching motility protein PilT [Candidatus Omnitrophota bacterium]
MEKNTVLRELLLLAIQKGASDLHLTENTPPVLRIDGRLVMIEHGPLSREQLQDIIFEGLSSTQRKQFEDNKELDFSLAMTGLDRFRVNVHYQRGCAEAAFRRVSLFIPTMEELQLPVVLGDLARKQNGLVLITGATGTGKSTTMAAMINLINHERECVIISIEDPIEYVHVNKKSVIKQREVYRDTNSFAEALRRCLRQDPDVIVVGEMRDLETISTALTAAETGHLVLATLHTPDAPQTIERIIDVFPPYQQHQVRLQLASALQGVISQQLVPRAGGKGRLMVPEIMIATAGVRNMIREQASGQLRTAIQTGAQYGMKTMDKSLKEVYEKGLITYETAITYAHNIDELKSLLGKR